MQKIVFLVGLFMIVACANSTKKPVSTTQLEVDQLIQKIEAETAALTASISDRIVQEIHACEIKDYKGQKKHIFCFAGGTKAQEATVYYVEGQAIAAFYTLEHYNASPANLAEFEETKTVKKQVKLYFKDGNLNAVDKVLDLNNKLVAMDEEQLEEWEILVAAIQ